MCNPMIAVAAITMASTAYQIQVQDAQAQYNADMQADNAKRNNEAVMDNWLLQNRAMNDQQRQDDDTASSERQKAMLAMQKAEATQRVGAGEAGLSGLSIDFLLNDIQRQGLDNVTSIDANLDSATAQRRYERQVMNKNANASFANLAAPFKAGNSGLGSALLIGGAGASSYMAAGGTFGSSGTTAATTASTSGNAAGGLKAPSGSFWK